MDYDKYANELWPDFIFYNQKTQKILQEHPQLSKIYFLFFCLVCFRKLLGNKFPRRSYFAESQKRSKLVLLVSDSNMNGCQSSDNCLNNEYLSVIVVVMTVS